MRIFKFGGASVKDAKAVKNIVKVLQHEGTENTLVVISAMGKMTNAFEQIIDAYYHKKDNLPETLFFAQNFHQEIIANLFAENNQIVGKVASFFGDLSGFMIRNTSNDYNYIYDQIIGFGELLSTTIVSEYLQEIGIANNWVDVRTLIKTDTNYRDAKVDWKATEKAILEKVNTLELNITQGFLGGNNELTTTLGREGSDYTAAIFAYCLGAENVTIWKDVPGVLNADPRVFSQTTLLESISYTEAIEMAFYGASVIHPKTIQPLEQKNIPLYVRSFDTLAKQGTCVSAKEGIEPCIPCYIVKKNQILLAISAKDFSFMVENNISYIFKKLHEYKLKVNLIQNSAISFSVCIEDKFINYTSFCKDLENTFNLQTYNNVTLFTIRYAREEAIKKINKRGACILTQINTNTAQLVIKENR